MSDDYREEHEPRRYIMVKRIGRVLEFLVTVFIIIPIHILATIITHIHAIFLLSIFGAIGTFIYIIAQIRSTIP